MDFHELDVNKLYAALAKVISDEEDVIVKFTVKKKERRNDDGLSLHHRDQG